MDTATRPRPRVDVLAYPAPTTTRFFLVVTTLLAAGLLVGTWVHTALPVGDAYDWAQVECRQQAYGAAPAAPTDPAFIQETDQYFTCMAPFDQIRAAFSAGGLLTGALGGLFALYVAPVLVRRRRGLREPGPRLAAARERLGALAVEAGVSPAPRLAIGSARSRDAFCFGTPGRYTVVLPPKIASTLGRKEVYEPLVRHELAHIAARDVPVAWISRSVLYAMAPLLLVPVVLDLVTGDLSALPDYAWRAALIAAVALLISRATLRSREFDADLRAVARQPSGTAPLVEVLDSARRPPSRRGWRQVLANHPDPAARVAVVNFPELAVRMTFVDGLSAAFLAAFSAPLLNQLATDLLTLDIVWMADVLSYLVVGPLLGSTIGLGLWRQAVVTRVADVRASVFPVAFGVGVGLGLGQVASLQSAGVGAAALPHAGWLAMNTAVAVGGTYAVAGLGELWADVGSRMRRQRTAWTAAILMSGFVFTFVLWVSEKLRQAFYAGGWAMAGRALFNDIDWAIPAVLAAVLAGAVLCVSLAGGRSPVAPTWLLEVDETLPWPGPGRSMLKVTLISAGLAGTAGALTTVGYRLISGTGHHVYIYIAVSVASAGGAALALSALAPRRGPGLALLATPTAAVVAAFGLLIAGAPQGMTPLVWAPVVPITAGMGLLVAMLAAVAACAGIRRFECAPTWSVVAVGGVLAVLLPVGAIAGQTGLTAFADSERVTERIGEGDAYVEVLTYQTAIAPEATTRLTAAMTEVAELSRDVSLSPEERAALLTGGPIADLRTLLDDMRALSFRDPLLVALHEELLTALDLRKQAWQDYAQSLMTDDPTQLTEANQLRAQADDHLAEWRSGRHRLENYNKSLID